MTLAEDTAFNTTGHRAIQPFVDDVKAPNKHDLRPAYEVLTSSAYVSLLERRESKEEELRLPYPRIVTRAHLFKRGTISWNRDPYVFGDRLDYPLKDYAKEMKCLPSARHAAMIRQHLSLVRTIQGRAPVREGVTITPSVRDFLLESNAAFLVALLVPLGVRSMGDLFMLAKFSNQPTYARGFRAALGYNVLSMEWRKTQAALWAMEELGMLQEIDEYL